MFTYLTIFVLPLDYFYQVFRMELLFTLFNVCFSPITPVRFKDFFLADVFCSLVKPFNDIYIVTCLLSSYYWYSYSELPTVVAPSC